MPSPVIYVVAVVATVAAGIAFKQHVYDPHVAPKVEQWSEAYTAYRRERRRRRTAPQPHSAPNDKDDGRGHSDDKSSVELESLIEREMHTLEGPMTLRHRTGAARQGNAGEMMEKPNTFIPFMPLSPTPARSPSPLQPNPFLSRSETALPMGRLPTPVSDHTPRLPPTAFSPAVPDQGRNTGFPEHASPSMFTPYSHSPSPSPSLVSASRDTFGPASERADLGPVSRPAEFEIVFPHSGPGSRASSRASHAEYDFIHPSASVSRSITPFTDTHSEASFTDSHSEASFTESHSESSLDDFEADSEVEFLRPDPDPDAGSEAELLHAGSEMGFSSVGYDAGLQRAGSDAGSGYSRSDAEFLRSPSRSSRGHFSMSEAGSDDWERVSETSGAR